MGGLGCGRRFPTTEVVIREGAAVAETIATDNLC